METQQHMGPWNETLYFLVGLHVISQAGGRFGGGGYLIDSVCADAVLWLYETHQYILL